ncbi:hypothetical protein H6P81_017126 [Aristolochia fimbriata]|uniref:Neprosin PEP catalytic domain-containing protein n=1 Tax=Aristolochia fimbriata TaxID=158543 RepID=A0AAV7E0C1_ARIFI|nr:hypothetical protein H6P81_017126 [Aristolochia fimbriata]
MGFQKMVLQNMLLLSLLVYFSNYGVEGRKETKEDLELERQLKLLNKPAIKIIQTEHGIYDCVDINKQPAFDSPLLRDHKVQMQPTSPQLLSPSKDATGLRSEDIELKDGGCPMGTVPIRRTTKEELIKSKDLFPIIKGLSSAEQKTTQLAFVAVTGEGGYYGTEFSLNTWNPPVKRSVLTFSSMNAAAQYRMTEIVQAGWLVYPDYYGDNETHLYILWSATGPGGCLNLQCPGFVHVNPALPLGDILKPYSIAQTQHFDMKFRISMDMQTEDWWLLLGADNKQVGYWPRSLFSHLSSVTGATLLSWAGLAGTLPKQYFPPIGSGHYAEDGIGMACYFKNVLFMDGLGVYRKMDEHFMFSRVDSNLYSVTYDNFKGDWGWTLFIGGPGGRLHE